MASAGLAISIEMDEVVVNTVPFEMQLTLTNERDEPYEFKWRHRDTDPPYRVRIHGLDTAFSTALFGGGLAVDYVTTQRVRTYSIGANASLEFEAVIDFRDCHRVGRCATVRPGRYAMEVTVTDIDGDEAALSATREFEVVEGPTQAVVDLDHLPSIEDVSGLVLTVDAGKVGSAPWPLPVRLTVANASSEPVEFYVCHRPVQPPYRGYIWYRADSTVQGPAFAYPYDPYRANTTLATGRKHPYRVEARGTLVFKDEIGLSEALQPGLVMPGAYDLRVGIGSQYGPVSSLVSFVVRGGSRSGSDAPRNASSPREADRRVMAALMEKAASLPQCDVRGF